MSKSVEHRGIIVDEAPRSGVQEIMERAADGRRRTARILEVFPATGQDTLEADSDPFKRAITAQGEEITSEVA